MGARGAETLNEGKILSGRGEIGNIVSDIAKWQNLMQSLALALLMFEVGDAMIAHSKLIMCRHRISTAFSEFQKSVAHDFGSVCHAARKCPSSGSLKAKMSRLAESLIHLLRELQ